MGYRIKGRERNSRPLCEVEVKERNFQKFSKNLLAEGVFGSSSSEIHIFGYTDPFFMRFLAINLISLSDFEKNTFYDFILKTRSSLASSMSTRGIYKFA